MRNIISAEPKPQEPQASQKPQAASDGKSIASLVLGGLSKTLFEEEKPDCGAE
jgi:hypothetical protein